MSERTLQLLLIAFGASQVLLALWMVADPASFFDNVGPFGERNDHYLRDTATFIFGLGAGLLLAARHVSWRVPALVVAAISFGAHSLNHLFDIGAAEPRSKGVTNFVSLTLGTLLLVYLARVARRHRLAEPAERR